MDRVSKRLSSELKECKSSLPHGIVRAEPVNEDDLSVWIAEIEGPSGSPYEGYKFPLQIIFPIDYPISPPQIRFTTRVYHPNISAGGHICVDILKKDDWSPAITITKALLGIQSLMASPAPESALVDTIGDLFENNREEYNRIARKWAKKWGSPL